MIFVKVGGTWKVVGDHYRKFNNLISQSTRDVVPPYYPSWEKVSASLRQQIVNLQQVRNSFKLIKNYYFTLDL